MWFWLVPSAAEQAEGQDVCITQRWSHKGESCESAAQKKQVDVRLCFLQFSPFDSLYNLVKWLLMKDRTSLGTLSSPSSCVLCHQFRLICGHWPKNLCRTSWSSVVYLKSKTNSRLFHSPSKDDCIVNVYLKSQTKLKTYHVQIPVHVCHAFIKSLQVPTSHVECFCPETCFLFNLPSILRKQKINDPVSAHLSLLLIFTIYFCLVSKGVTAF